MQLLGLAASGSSGVAANSNGNNRGETAADPVLAARAAEERVGDPAGEAF